MIYDCFPFFNELDLLEIRLNVLKDVVDKFVLVEMPVTHTGKPKPLYYEENKERFKEFHDKIIHIVANDYPSLEGSKVGADGNKWILENFQRDKILDGLKEAEDDDIIISSDLDEIPSPEGIQEYLRAPYGIKKLVQQIYYYYLNNRLDNSLTQAPTICTYKSLLDPKVYMGESELFEHSSYGKPTYLRWIGIDSENLFNINRIQNGGWHFSFLGNFEQIKKKIEAIVEGEQWHRNSGMSMEDVKTAIETNHDIFNRADWDNFITEELDYSYPKYLVENQEKYKHLLREVTDSDRIKKMQVELYDLKKVVFQQNSMIKQLFDMIRGVNR